VVAARHVAALAGGRCGALGQDARLLQQVAHAMLRGGIHLPLGVVDAHVAGPAGLGLQGFLPREDVPGVTGVAGGDPELAALFAQLFDFIVCFSADLVAAPAPFHAVHQRHGLHVEGGHGLQGGPGLGVFAVLELLDLWAMAVGAAFWRRDLGQGDRLEGEVLVAVADGAIDPLLAVLAQLPVRHDPGGHGRVAQDTVFRRGYLFLLRGEVRLDPSVPSALDRVGLRVSPLVKLNRHPGGRVLLGSGSVEDVSGVLLWMVFDEFVEFVRLGEDRPGDMPVAFFVLLDIADVHDDDIGLPEHVPDVFVRQARHLFHRRRRRGPAGQGDKA